MLFWNKKIKVSLLFKLCAIENLENLSIETSTTPIKFEKILSLYNAVFSQEICSNTKIDVYTVQQKNMLLVINKSIV